MEDATPFYNMTDSQLFQAGLKLLRGPMEEPIEIVEGKLSARPTYLATTGVNGNALPLLRLHRDAESLDFPGQKTWPLQIESWDRFVWVGTNMCIFITSDKFSFDPVQRYKVRALDAVLCWLNDEKYCLKGI